MSIKKMVQLHLYVIAFSFLVLAGLSLRISGISSSNFDDSIQLHSRVAVLDEAMYKLMVIRGDVLFLKVSTLTQQDPGPEWMASIQKDNQEIRRNITEWVKTPKSSVEIQTVSEKTGVLLNRVLDNYLGFASNLDNNASIIDETDELLLQLEALTGEYLRTSAAVMDEYQDRAGFLHDVLWATLACLVALFVLVYLSLTRYITRMILNRLSEATDVFSQISQGELAKKVPEYGRNEMGKLFSGIETMRTALVEMIGGVKSVAVNIRHNAIEIADGNNNLSARTEEQASALQQTAASMEQIKTTVENNTAHAREANRLATEAKIMADDGSVIMVDVVRSMDQIAGNATQIANIIKVIDGIASQTNILALNAAVEAARAGEQGRGFAVVASEVRNLAQRSADASKEIRGLIELSVEDTEAGSKRVDHAKNTITGIVDMVSKVSGIMQDITQASEEQNMGIQQVSVAINQMDVVTQQNSALVEESAAITAVMDEQTTQLESMVAVFHIEADPQTA
ncbi:methyl-accepting chemotaxis protein [Rahnella bruchi]|uniref:methyl-accepting chemotaxis protein n=2 Tax=Rahnella bruchi TaxID=1510573 RepID=UPI0039EF91DE